MPRPTTIEELLAALGHEVGVAAVQLRDLETSATRARIASAIDPGSAAKAEDAAQARRYERRWRRHWKARETAYAVVRAMMEG